MSQMRARSSTAWEGIFTPKWYGIRNGSGSADQWNTFTGVTKVYVAGEWVPFWPPGVNGSESVSEVYITWADVTVNAFNYQPLGGGNATASITFASNGDLTKSINGGASTDIGSWISSDPTGVGANYEIRVSVSGSGGTYSDNIVADGVTWNDLGVNATMSLENSVAEATYTRTLTVTIREDGDPATEVTATLTLEAQYSEGTPQ